MVQMTLLAMLQRNRLFGSLPGKELERIASLATRREAPAGSILFVQGDPGEFFYAIESGQVRISASSPDGRELHFVELGPDDTFGEIALLDGGPRTATAIVATDASLAVVERRAFHALIAREPGLALRLLERLCERLRWTSELVEDLSFLSLDAQIAKRICLLAHRFGENEPDGRALKITQADLAAFLGVSRQSINSHLQRWRDDGIITTRRGKLVILDMGRLQAAAQ